jgi:uncharacterized membrane protein
MTGPLTIANVFDVVVQAAVIAQAIPGVTTAMLTPVLASVMTTLIQELSPDPTQSSLLASLVADHMTGLIVLALKSIPKVEQEVESACGACWKLCCPCFASK